MASYLHVRYKVGGGSSGGAYGGVTHFAYRSKVSLFGQGKLGDIELEDGWSTAAPVAPTVHR